MVHLDGVVGGPGRDRTDDLFHAMEARSQLRHRPTLRKDRAEARLTYFRSRLPLSQTAILSSSNVAALPRIPTLWVIRMVMTPQHTPSNRLVPVILIILLIV